MIDQLITHRYYGNENEDKGISWPRVIGIAFVIALHLAALLLLLIPAVAPKSNAVQKDRDITVQILEPEKPPPPPPPPPPKPDIPPPPVRTLAPPRAAPVTIPPPIDVPVEVDDPREVDIPTPQPEPETKPVRVESFEASVDISSKNRNPPKYPPTALRAGITGTVVLIISVDVNGNVTDVAVERSSRNRELDRAAVTAARGWKFNPGSQNGQAVAGRVLVPVEFTL